MRRALFLPLFLTLLTLPSAAQRHHKPTDLEEIDRYFRANIYPRDIFGCLRHRNCNVPIRGWKLKSGGPGWDFAGSEDISTWVYTASKGTKKRYFWVYVKQGVDATTDQSVDETRVKQLDSPKEDPYLNQMTKRGLWSDDHQWFWEDMPNGGVCIEHPLTDLAMSQFPMTREECEKQPERQQTCPLTGNLADDKSKCTYGTRVILKPYQDTPPEKNCDTRN